MGKKYVASHRVYSLCEDVCSSVLRSGKNVGWILIRPMQSPRPTPTGTSVCSLWVGWASAGLIWNTLPEDQAYGHKLRKGPSSAGCLRRYPRRGGWQLCFGRFRESRIIYYHLCQSVIKGEWKCIWPSVFSWTRPEAGGYTKSKSPGWPGWGSLVSNQGSTLGKIAQPRRRRSKLYSMKQCHLQHKGWA